MTRLWLYGAIGALAAAGYAGFYLKGRSDGALDCERRLAAIAAEAVDEKAADDARQAENARTDRSAMEIENARLRRILRERSAHAETGRNCLEPRDADGLRDDYDAIFGERLQAGREPDGAE